MNRSSEQGSAIIWILVALATFAALNYAFNSSSRTSTSLLTDEEAVTYANQIIAYGNDVKSAVKRLQLRGCDETEISFENSVVAGYTNPNSPANRSCHVFDVNGGGLNIKDELSNLSQQFYGDIPFEGVATSEPELSMQIAGIDKSVCLKINEILNLDDSNDDDYTDEVPHAVAAFTGTYGVVSVTNNIGNDVASFNGKKSLCRQDGSSTFHYMTVLIAR